MADEKGKKDKSKDKPKDKPAGWNLNPIEGLIVLLVLASIAATVLPPITGYISSGEISFYGFKFSGLVDFFKSNIQFFKTLGFTIAGVAALGTFIFTKKADTIWREEKERLSPPVLQAPSQTPLVDNQPVGNPVAERWQKIVKHTESENQSDWRLAIIEADIILDDLLEQLHLPGDTMGDKLKAVEKSDFTTIEYAWEAHKARNMIAHQGSDFLLNQRETRRIISLYEAVFKEFSLI